MKGYPLFELRPRRFSAVGAHDPNPEEHVLRQWSWNSRRLSRMSRRHVRSWRAVVLLAQPAWPNHDRQHDGCYCQSSVRGRFLRAVCPFRNRCSESRYWLFYDQFTVSKGERLIRLAQSPRRPKRHLGVSGNDFIKGGDPSIIWGSAEMISQRVAPRCFSFL